MSDKSRKSEKYAEAVTVWWNSLSLVEKQKCRLHYEKIREQSLLLEHPFPRMKDTMNQRLENLSLQQIKCIWLYKDHDEKIN